MLVIFQHHTIKGYDKAPSAVSKAKDNIRNANLEEYITISEENFFDTEKTSEGKLQIVFNPPYDERLDIHMEEFYKNIGDRKVIREQMRGLLQET